jgi:23S rRNA (adenine2030-N6)-methyltransferase
MPYNHSGEIGDIWKHLPLCDILAIEKPRRYIETNSAFPSYILPNKSRLDYGVHRFMENAETRPPLAESIYYRILQSFQENPLTHYLGSPGLAMTILRDMAHRYIFCDLESDPLGQIRSFSDALGIGANVETIHGDSIDFGLQIIPDLTEDDFIFLDPYKPWDHNGAGYSYCDLFIALAKANRRCVLWYGYDTLVGKAQIASFPKQALTQIECQRHRLKSVDVSLKLLEADKVPFNPGVPGCGILIANLSELSAERLSLYGDELVAIYKDAKYEGFDGELVTDSIIF